MRKVAVITGSRAEYGLLRGIMRRIADEPTLALMVVATGMSLDPAFGATYKEIEADGFPLAGKVAVHRQDDTSVGMARSIGAGVLGFAGALEELAPDVAVVLGDRFEIFAAVIAAATLGIPVAHLHGGETTEGAVDEMYRHAITKMSYLHFPASDIYAGRIVKMGESPDRVVNVGAPGLEGVTALTPMTKDELASDLGFTFAEPTIMVTYHPVTLAEGEGIDAVERLFEAFDRFPDLRLLFTLPNADAGGRRIAERVKAYVERNRQRATFVASLGQRRYFSALRHVAAMVGNSSSGLIEAPAFGLPTVNIGDRQKGRLRGPSVIDCGDTADEIAKALERALTPEFREIAQKSGSPYDTKETSRLVVETLRDFPLPKRAAKVFYDGDDA